MNILSINTSELGGGAANIAATLSAAAPLYDSQAYFLVSEQKTSASNVDQLPTSSWRKRWSQLRGSDLSGFLSAAIFAHPFYQQADIIHLHNLHGYYFDLTILPRLCREKKVVWTFHDLWPLTASCSHTERWDLYCGLSLCHGRKLYPRFLCRRQKAIIDQKLAIYQQSDFTIVAPCQWMDNKISQSALVSKKRAVIYNGINHNLFAKQANLELRKKLNLPQGRRLALFLADGGSANRWKGWSYYQTLRQRYGSDLFFISIGHHQADLLRNSDYWQLPYLRQAEVAEYLGAADVFLFTSVAENFPLVVLEAMASGLPVISFDVGGVSEVLAHRINGYLAESNSLSDFVSGIAWFLKLSPEELGTIKQVNHDLIAKKFSGQLMSAEYYQLYQQLLNQD